MKEYDEKENVEKDLDEKGEEEEEEKNEFPDAWNPNPMNLVSKLFLIIPAAVCSTIYLAISICALLIPSPTWYTVTMQIMVVPCYLFATFGGVSGILGALFLHKSQFVCRLMLNFYRLSGFFAQTLTAFLSEFVGMCIAFESASGSMNNQYFDFERKRIEYMNHIHNAFFPGDSELCIKVSSAIYIAITIMLVVSNLANSCFGVTRFSNVVIGDKMNSRLYGYVALFRILFLCIVEFNAIDGLPPWGMFGFGRLKILWGTIYAVLGVLVLVGLVTYTVYFHYLWYREHPFSLDNLQAQLEAIPLIVGTPSTLPVSDSSLEGTEDGAQESGKNSPNANPKPNGDGEDSPDTPNSNTLTRTHSPPVNTENITRARPTSSQRGGRPTSSQRGERPTSSQHGEGQIKEKVDVVIQDGGVGAGMGGIKAAAVSEAPPQTTPEGMPLYYCPDGVTLIPSEEPLLFTEQQHRTLMYMRHFLTIALIVTLVGSIITWVFSLYYFIVIGVISIMHDNTATYHIPLMDASKGENINYYNLYVSANLDGDVETDNAVAVYRIADFIETVSVKGLTTSAVMAIFFYGFGMISSGMFWWCFVFSVAKDNNGIIKSFESSFQTIDVRLIADARLKREQWIKKQEIDAGKQATEERLKEEKKAAKRDKKAAKAAAKAAAREAAANDTGIGVDAGMGEYGNHLEKEETEDFQPFNSDRLEIADVRIGADPDTDRNVRGALSGLTIVANASDSGAGLSGYYGIGTGTGSRTGTGSGTATPGSGRGRRSGGGSRGKDKDAEDDEPVVVGISDRRNEGQTVFEDYNENMPVFDLN